MDTWLTIYILSQRLHVDHCTWSEPLGPRLLINGRLARTSDYRWELVGRGIIRNLSVSPGINAGGRHRHGAGVQRVGGPTAAWWKRKARPERRTYTVTAGGSTGCAASKAGGAAAPRCGASLRRCPAWRHTGRCMRITGPHGAWASASLEAPRLSDAQYTSSKTGICPPVRYLFLHLYSRIVILSIYHPSILFFSEFWRDFRSNFVVVVGHDIEAT
jgi:hypothetical protein